MNASPALLKAMDGSAEVKVEEICGSEVWFPHVTPPSNDALVYMETFSVMFTCIHAAMRLLGLAGFTARYGSVSGNPVSEMFLSMVWAEQFKVPSSKFKVRTVARMMILCFIVDRLLITSSPITGFLKFLNPLHNIFEVTEMNVCFSVFIYFKRGRAEIGASFFNDAF